MSRKLSSKERSRSTSHLCAQTQQKRQQPEAMRSARVGPHVSVRSVSEDQQLCGPNRTTTQGKAGTRRRSAPLPLPDPDSVRDSELRSWEETGSSTGQSHCSREEQLQLGANRREGGPTGNLLPAIFNCLPTPIASCGPQSAMGPHRLPSVATFTLNVSAPLIHPE